MLALGDSLLLPKPRQDIPHLWLIITEPETDTGLAIIVNLTTKRPHSDVTVVLHPGDHPFVQHQSVVNYSDARLVDTRHLEAAILSGLCRTHQKWRYDVVSG